MDEGLYQRMVTIAFKVVEDENKALKARVAELEASAYVKMGHQWRFIHYNSQGEGVVQCNRCMAYERENDVMKNKSTCKNAEK